MSINQNKVELISNLSEEELNSIGFNEEKVSDSSINPRKIIVVDTVPTTMTIAEKKMESGEMKANDILIALEQTEGKGQNDRNWISPRGNLYMNMLVDISNPDVIKTLALMVGLAVNQTLRGDYQINSEVKWPNDIVVRNTQEVYEKICGILVKNNHIYKMANVGIGVNLNTTPEIITDKFVHGVTSLKEKLDDDITISDFLIKFLTRFDRILKLVKVGKKTDLILEYNSVMASRLKKVRIHNERNETFDQGTLIGVEKETCGLKVGNKRYYSGRLEIIHS